VLQIARRKPPFGIAQVGKSFRNEITPGNFLFRTREFEQMEMEFFVPPAGADRWYRQWIDIRRRWYLDLGLRESHLRVREHDADELSHYSSGTSDLEYCSRSAGRSSRASRTAATSTSPSTPSTRERSSSGSATTSATSRT
jgi:glycyl-tRNA synthetase (class II)